MDFIEQIFHVSPDQGTGTLEVIIVSALCTLALAAVATMGVRAWRYGAIRRLR